MENQPVIKSPGEWEHLYMQQLQTMVSQWESYTNQLKANNGGYFGTQGSYAALDYANRIRVYLDQYDITAKWFSDRQMPKFPDYLAFLKKDFEGVINICTQMYQDSLKTDLNIFTINAQANISIAQTYNNIYLSQKKAFDDMNQKWMDNFMS